MKKSNASRDTTNAILIILLMCQTCIRYYSLILEFKFLMANEYLTHQLCCVGVILVGLLSSIALWKNILETTLCRILLYFFYFSLTEASHWKLPCKWKKLSKPNLMMHKEESQPSTRQVFCCFLQYCCFRHNIFRILFCVLLWKNVYIISMRQYYILKSYEAQ